MPDVTEITKKETVEVITDGRAAAESPLAAMFEKMEQGKPVHEAAKEVAAEKNQVTTPVTGKAKGPEGEATPAPDEQKKLEESSLAKQLEADFERKNAPKAEDTQPEVKAETKLEEVPEEELQVLQTDKPKTAKRIQALLARTAKIQESEALTKKELEARDAKLKELEAQLVEAKKVTVDPATEAAIKAQQEELAMFRRQYELDKDPEVKSKFDDRVTGAEKAVTEVLVKNGAEPLSKIVAEEGGWLAFTRSGRLINTRDGEKTAAEVAAMVMDNLPFADKQTLQAVTIEQVATKRERERFFQEEKKKAMDYFQKREEEAKRGSLEHLQQVEAAKKVIEDFKADMATKNEWLKEKEIPATATPEQKAAIEDDNKHTKQIRQELDKAIGVKDIPGMLEVVKNAVQYHQERRLHARTQQALEQLKAENAKIKADLDKFKNASRTVNKPGSLLAESRQADPSVTKKAPASLDEAFELLAAGKSLSGDDE